MTTLRSLLLLLLLMAAPAWAIKPFVAEYDAQWKGVPATATIRLQPADGGAWRYELIVENAVGNARQVTVFEEHNGMYRPLSGTDSAQMLFKKSLKQARYDWTAREARWSGDVKPDRTGPVRLQDGDVDAMLINLAIIRDLAAGKPLVYRVVDNGTAHVQTYRAEGRESMTIDGKTRNVTRVARVDDDKQILVWVADGLPAPARIVQRKNGQDELELVLKALH